MIVIEKVADGEVSLETPYNRNFVEDLKAVVDWKMRKWDPDHKVWIVRSAIFNRVHELLDDHYPYEDLYVSPDAQKEIQKGYKQSVDYFQDGYLPPGISAGGSTGPYATLFVADNAPDCVVTAAHKALARMHHPDVGGDRDAMAAVNAAMDEIKKLRGL